MRKVFVFAAVMLVVAGLFYMTNRQEHLPVETAVETEQPNLSTDAEQPRQSASALALREESLQALYTGCLAKLGEDMCMRLHGPMAWYPRGAAECGAIGARIDKVIGLGGDPKVQDLFKNERCARLAMPHSADAAGKVGQPDLGAAYRDCLYGSPDGLSDCDEQLGQYRKFPSADSCSYYKPFVDGYISTYRIAALEKGAYPVWEWFFVNERCWRLGLEFLEPEFD